MNIDRCYCFDLSFEDLKRVAQETGVTSVEGLRRHVTFGENCQLCHPYVRCMLNTGKTAFDEVIVAEEGASDSQGQ